MTDTEMTRFLAEKCMGWITGPHAPKGNWHDAETCKRAAGAEWNPLSSISDAFQVVEKMRQMDKYVRVEISPAGKSAVMIWRRGVVFTARDDSPARAICLAAIAALEGKNA